MDKYFERTLREAITDKKIPGGFFFNVGMNSDKETKNAISNIRRECEDCDCWTWIGDVNLGSYTSEHELQTAIVVSFGTKIDDYVTHMNGSRTFWGTESDRLKFVKMDFKKVADAIARAMTEPCGGDIASYVLARHETPELFTQAVSALSSIASTNTKFVVTIDIDDPRAIKQLWSIRNWKHDNLIFVINIQFTYEYFNEVVRSSWSVNGTHNFSGAHEYINSFTLSDRIYIADSESEGISYGW